MEIVIIAALALLGLLTWALYAAPVQTLGATLAVAAITHPDATALVVGASATLLIAAGLVVIWRSLSGSGWHLITVTVRPAKSAR